MTETLWDAITDLQNAIENVLDITDNDPIGTPPELISFRAKLEDLFYSIHTL